MHEGISVFICSTEMPEWDGVAGRITSVYAAGGVHYAVVRLYRIALSVIFPVGELRIL